MLVLFVITTVHLNTQCTELLLWEHIKIHKLTKYTNSQSKLKGQLNIVKKIQQLNIYYLSVEKLVECLCRECLCLL